jgi:hypothetical protein
MMSETDMTTPGTATWRGAVLLNLGYSGDDQYHSYQKVAQREFGEDREPDAHAWVETILREVERRAPVPAPDTLPTAHYFGQLERGRYNELLPGHIMWEVQTNADPRFVATMTAGETITWSDARSHYTLADDDFYSSTYVPVLFSDATVDQWLAETRTSARSTAPGRATAAHLAGMSFTSGQRHGGQRIEPLEAKAKRPPHRPHHREARDQLGRG